MLRPQIAEYRHNGGPSHVGASRRLFLTPLGNSKLPRLAAILMLCGDDLLREVSRCSHGRMQDPSVCHFGAWKAVEFLRPGSVLAVVF